MMIRSLLSLSVAAALLSLSACASLLPAANTARPGELPVPASLSAPSGQPLAASVPGDTAEPDWQAVVREPRLRQVVQLALTHNSDLRLAVLNIDAARAQYRLSEADLLPTLNATATRARSGTASGVSQQSSVSLGVSAWELDLWGRLGDLRSSALSSALATEQTRRSVQQTLVAEVAQAWLTLAADEQLLALASSTLGSRERTLALTEQRQALGAASGLDLQTARAAVASARAAQASARTNRQQAVNALRLLVGTELPAALQPDARVLDTDTATLQEVPAQLASSVLLARPDVRAAELKLQASEAEVSAARAALFPTISLTASAGTASSALSGLFKAGSQSWSIAPSLKLPIFDGGASQTELAVARVARQQQLVSYEQTVQTAFKEAADALAERADLADRLAAQRLLVDAQTRTLALTEKRRALGAESALAVLDAQRSLDSARQTLIALQLTEQSNRLTLFKVLGGA